MFNNLLTQYCVKGICVISALVIVLIMQDLAGFACCIERRKTKIEAREVDIPVVIVEGGRRDRTN